MESTNRSLMFWPPSESKRLMIVEKMTKGLKNPSTLSTRYSGLSIKEAEEHAKQIESMAFATASQEEGYGDGSSTVRLYTRECARLVFRVVRRGLAEKQKTLDETKEVDDNAADELESKLMGLEIKH